MHDDTTARRKDAHLDLCASEDVAPRENSTLLSDVRLVHCSLPELAVSQIDLRTEWFGKKLKAPLLITGMTGGTERAAQVNRDLARVAEEFGVAFGVGSQRAMAERPELTATFSVRDVAPSTVVIGNLGVVQAANMTVDQIRRLTDGIGADALALHLNPGQELNQPEGDRDFQRGYLTITALARAWGDRLIVKETGCGISPSVARRLVDCGVKHRTACHPPRSGRRMKCSAETSAARPRWSSSARSPQGAALSSRLSSRPLALGQRRRDCPGDRPPRWAQTPHRSHQEERGSATPAVPCPARQ